MIAMPTKVISIDTSELQSTGMDNSKVHARDGVLRDASSRNRRMRCLFGILVVILLLVVVIIAVVLSQGRDDNDSNKHDDNDNHSKEHDDKCGSGTSCSSKVCIDGVCFSEQAAALMSLYKSTDGPNWDTGTTMNWASLNINECEWGGVTCTNKKVTKLSRGADNLNGVIPTELGLLTELTFLNLYGNKLIGPIPSTLGSLSKLVFFNMGFNELTGRIPTEFGRLTSLQRLWLYSNNLTGVVPAQITSMADLETLCVQKNNLDRIPTEICGMDLSNLWADCSLCSSGCCSVCF